MPIIAVTNQKGGVGKTTTAVNLAAVLAKLGQETLLIDADPQGNASSGLGLKTDQVTTGTYDVLMAKADLAAAAQPTAWPNLNVLAASADLAGCEVELADVEGRYVRLARQLANHPYAFVLIDCPPALGFLTLNALVAARWALVPVQAEYYALEGLGSLLDTIRRVQHNFNPELRLLGIVLTMVNRQTKLASSVTADLRRHFPNELLETVIPRSVRLAEAAGFAEPIIVFDRQSKGALAYDALAKEVIDAAETRTRQRA